jgi:hypothetical protein
MLAGKTTNRDSNSIRVSRPGTNRSYLLRAMARLGLPCGIARSHDTPGARQARHGAQERIVTMPH